MKVLKKILKSKLFDNLSSLIIFVLILEFGAKFVQDYGFLKPLFPIALVLVSLSLILWLVKFHLQEKLLSFRIFSLRKSEDLWQLSFRKTIAWLLFLPFLTKILSYFKLGELDPNWVNGTLYVIVLYYTAKVLVHSWGLMVEKDYAMDGQWQPYWIYWLVAICLYLFGFLHVTGTWWLVTSVLLGLAIAVYLAPWRQDLRTTYVLEDEVEILDKKEAEEKKKFQDLDEEDQYWSKDQHKRIALSLGLYLLVFNLVYQIFRLLENTVLSQGDASLPFLNPDGPQKILLLTLFVTGFGYIVAKTLITYGSFGLNMWVRWQTEDWPKNSYNYEYDYDDEDDELEASENADQSQLETSQDSDVDTSHDPIGDTEMAIDDPLRGHDWTLEEHQKAAETQAYQDSVDETE